MSKSSIKAAQLGYTGTGELKIDVTSTLGLIPIANARISITLRGETGTPMETVTTDQSGQTAALELPTPPFSYSQEPDEPRPYAEYDLNIEAPGYEPAVIQGTQVLPDVTALQPVQLVPLETSTEAEEKVDIPDHTLYGIYPPKIPEDEIKTVAETGEIVLSRVVIPEYIVVHDGVPDDRSAQNYYVKYKDYIKNVLSNEIYPTWSEDTIYANTLVVQSFTLNRVYTEWCIPGVLPWVKIGAFLGS